jgi:hypothetical protein
VRENTDHCTAEDNAIPLFFGCGRRQRLENLVASSPVASWLKVRSSLWRKSNAAFIHHLEFAASRI